MHGWESAMKDVKDKVVVITGAAMGMGQAFAEKFGENGAKLALVDRNEKALAQTCAALTDRGFIAVGFACDITDRKAVYKTADAVTEKLGPARVLINNAGVVFPGNLLDQADENIEATFSVNVLGMIWATKAFLPGMLDDEGGHLINMASASGFIAVGGLAPYSASKWAVIGLCEALRGEIAQLGKNVKVTVVCPSYVSTGMFAGAKAPILTNFLKTEEIVNKVYDGFTKDKLYVMAPWLMKSVPLLKGVLPARSFDRLLRVMGISTGANNLVGRE